MIVGQVLSRINDSVHIGLHKISNDVDIFVSSLRWRASNVDKCYDVLMVEKFEKFDFTNDSFGIN